MNTTKAHTPETKTRRVTVRHTRAQDVPRLIELQRRTYTMIEPWSEAKFANQLEVFPQGQIVAEINGRIVGTASSLVVMWDEWPVEHSWAEITGSGRFDPHTPHGRTLYGAEVFVDSSLRGIGVGRELYRARRRICRALNLRRIIACGRLPGYATHAGEMDIDLYCKKVLWGDLTDPVLSFQLHEGFRYCGVVPGYLPEDTESAGYASLIVWLNRMYDSSRPTHVAEGDIL
ncbi:MAG: GNAT family N-acetyltransferase [Burkholderiaceae bacterium]|nr:GNAT family N-acetyltransferase [Burkholderiaceae bacterium]